MGSRFAATLLSCVLLLIGITTAFAELGVTPMLLSLEAEPGAVLDTAVHVYTTRQWTPEVDIRLADFKEDKEGPWFVAEPVLDRKHPKAIACREWLSVGKAPIKSSNESENSGWRTIPLRIHVPSDAQGLYSAAMVIREVPPQPRGGVDTVVELVVPVFVRIKGSIYPLDIQFDAANPIESFDLSSAKISAPASRPVTQCRDSLDPSRTYSGRLDIDIASNFPAALSIKTTPTSPAGGLWSTNATPTHIEGRSLLELTVTGRDVRIEKLIGGRKRGTVATMLIQLIPKFQMVYTARYLHTEKTELFPPSEDIKILTQWIKRERQSVRDQLKQLERLQKNINHQKQWGAIVSESPKVLGQDQIEKNSEQIEFDLQRVHSLKGALANADTWLQWYQHNWNTTTPSGLTIQKWLRTESLPWIVSFLEQLQQWQADSDVEQWAEALKQMAFLRTTNGYPIVEPVPCMPSLASVSLMPPLPHPTSDHVSVQLNANPQSISNDLNMVIQGALRIGILDLCYYLDTLILVDPRVEEGFINLDLTGRRYSLENVLDMVCLSTNTTWEKQLHFYIIKPCPSKRMVQPFPFEERESDQEGQQTIKAIFSGDSSMVVQDLSAEMAIPIIMHPKAATQGINMDLTAGVPPEIALDMICLSTGNIWKKAPGFYVIEPSREKSLELPYLATDATVRSEDKDQPMISNQWQNAYLALLLDDIFHETRVTLVADASLNLNQNFSMALHELPLETVLDAICLATDAAWQKTPYFYWIKARKPGASPVLPYTLTEANSQAEERRGPITTIDWQESRLSDALLDLAYDAGVNIIMDASLNRRLKLTGTLRELPLETALDAICLATDCIWQKTPYYYWVQPRGNEPMNLPYPLQEAVSTNDERSGPIINNGWEDMKLTEILMDLAFEAEVSLVVDRNVQGLVSTEIRNSNLETALDQICARTGTIWKKTPHYYLVAEKP